MNKIQRFHFACLLCGVICCPTVWAAATDAKPSPGGGQAKAATNANASPANAKAAAGNAKPASGGGGFDQLVDDFVLGTLALSPTAATGFGYHVHHGVSLDDVLDDFSPAGIAASHGLLQDIEGRIARLDGASLDAEQRADIGIMRDALGASRLELEEIQGYRHN